MFKSIFTACFLLVAAVAYTQSTDPSKDILPPSPTAAALTKFVDFPVNASTGTPSIGIPLGVLTGRGITVPISLDYHSSGVKVDEVASNIGLGWSMNAGGVVNRTVQGIADEENDGFLSRSDDVPLPPITTMAKYTAMQNFASGDWDGQPDVFNFSFPGYSGKFIFENPTTVRLIPQQDLKITYSTCTTCPAGMPSGAIISITITTPDGLQYMFGTEDAFEYATSNSYNVGGTTSCNIKNYTNPVATAWYLKTITNPKSLDVVTFTYGNNRVNNDLSYNESYVYGSMNTGGSESGNCPSNVSVSKCVSVKQDYGKYPISIQSSQGKVEFVSNVTRSDVNVVLGSNRITEIKFMGFENQLLKSYQLVQSFIQSIGTTASTDPVAKYRMYLDEVKELSSSSAIINSYTFEYNNRDQLPPRLSYKQDHWGFYNGKNNNQLSPNPNASQTELLYIQSFFPTFSPADRSVDATLTQYGILKKVTYPTGGEASYIYEGNQIAVCQTVDVPSNQLASAALTFSGSPQTLTYNFTLSTGQYVLVNYNVLMNGFRCSGASASLTAVGGGNPFTGITKGGCGQMISPVQLQGSLNQYLQAGTYKLEVKVFQGPEPGYPAPFGTQPEQASISVQYQGYTPTFVANKAIGGVRVKTITAKDNGSISPDIVKAYEYTKSVPGSCTNASSGVYMGRNPKYFTNSYSIFDPTAGQPTDIPCNYALCRSDRVSSTSLLNLTSNAGSIVTYREVWELDGLTGQNGKKYFKHEIFTDGNSQLGPNIVNVFVNTPTVDYSWKNGILIEEKVLSSTGALVSHKIYEYEFNELNKKTSTKAIVAQQLFEPFCPDVFIYTCDGVNNENDEFYVSCGFDLDDFQYECFTVYTSCWNLPTGTIINQSYEALEPYAIEWYDVVSQFVYLKKVTEKVYDSNGTGNYIQTVQETKYDIPSLRHYMPVQTINTNSDGYQYITKTSYPPEYTTYAVNGDVTHAAIKNLKTYFIINTPVETVSYIKKGSTQSVTSAQIVKYFSFNGGAQSFPFETWQLGITSIINDFVPASFNTNGIFSMDSRYYQTAQFGSYDTQGSLKEFNKKDDQESAFLYGHGENRPVAYIRNAKSTEVAYTGFEEPGQEASKNGGWAITGSTGGWSSTTGYVYAGKNGYNISNVRTLTKTLLPAGTYVVSFFYRSGQVLLNGVAVNTSYTNNWDYAEKTVTIAANGSIAITGNLGATYIDDLRLMPADALMRTFSYDNNSLLPLSISDENSVPAHFEYDNSQRLQVVRDQDRNILQTYTYTYRPSGATYNEIKARTVLVTGQTSIAQVDALTGASVKRVFSYLDGLGRPVQTSAVGQSPTSKDIVSLQQYDAYGRVAKAFLPYTIATNNGAFRTMTTALSDQLTFGNTFGAGSYPWSEQSFEASPANRVKEKAAPGATWRIGQKTVKISYRASTVADAVRNFSGTSNFSDTTLFVIEETDENDRKTITFADKLGRTVLVKQQLATAPAIPPGDNDYSQTYTIYDDFGRVQYIITPETTKKMKTSGVWTPSSYPSMVYSYTYDIRSRNITITIPSAGTTTLYYDRLDRPVLTIDANGFKTFTRYDILGRPVVIGRYKGSATPGTSEPLYETPNTTAPHYYTTAAFPTDNNLDVYKVFYYDDYDLNNNGTVSTDESYNNPAESGFETAAFMRLRSKATAEKTAILKNDNTAPSTYLTIRTYYDKEYSVIQTNKQNHLAGADIVSNAYDFANRLVKMRRNHTATVSGSAKNYTLREEYQYDHAGRLLYVLHQVNTQKKEIIAANVYDELDRLAQKQLHSYNYDGINMPGTPTYLQSLDYSYNIRGWLTSVNNPGSCSVQSGDWVADVFAMQLEYDGTTLGGTAQFNGNINAMQWRTNVNGVCGAQQLYRFSYDAADRLTAAAHREWSGSTWTDPNKFNESNITYDLNGNLKTYTRQGLITTPSTYGTMDQLTYFYEDAARPDRLTRITDAGNSLKGFRYNATAPAPHYIYDTKGNLTQDKHKGLWMLYNHMNLPNSIYDAGDNYLTLTYTANGEKLSKTAPGVNKNYAGGIEYSGSNLEAIYFSEGRLTPNGTAFYYDYTIKDHLGSARVNFRANGGGVTGLEQLHYYPFGLLMDGSSSGNKYTFNSHELNEELGVNLNFTKFRTYDPAIGRWWQIDPKPAVSNSSYSFVNNNPIGQNDILGDTLRAVNPVSAKRSLALIQSSFGVVNSTKVSSLFKLGKDGVTYNSISKKDLRNATRGLDRNQKALAKGYSKAINSTNVNTVEVVRRKDKLSDTSMKNLRDGDDAKKDGTGAGIDDTHGGGLTINTSYDGKEGSHVIVVMDAIRKLEGQYSDGVSRPSSAGEILAHELLGHALGQTSEAAVQAGNLFLGATLAPYHRENHNEPPSKGFNPQAIPNYLDDNPNLLEDE